MIDDYSFLVQGGRPYFGSITVEIYCLAPGTYLEMCIPKTEKEAVSLVETTFVDKKEIYGGEVERGETFRPEKM